MRRMGCYEISLGDTIGSFLLSDIHLADKKNLLGVGTPGSTAAMLDAVIKEVLSFDQSACVINNLRIKRHKISVTPLCLGAFRLLGSSLS